MLYKESKEYLLDKLKAAGLKSKPYTTQKALEKSQESHIGAVLFESETLLRNGSKTRYRDQEGAQKKRRKVFDRALAFTVIIGDYTDEAVESMFGAFLSSLDRGIYVNGDFVPIEVEGADWVDKDDSMHEPHGRRHLREPRSRHSPRGPDRRRAERDQSAERRHPQQHDEQRLSHQF